MPTSLSILDAASVLSGPQLSWLTDRAHAALATLQTGGDARVRIIQDAEMAEAHARFSGVPGTTDVLTFDLADPPQTRPALELGQDCSIFVRKKIVLDTDILICSDVAHRQSLARGHPIEAELLLYILHAALHCLGFDDAEEASAQEMHRVEDAVLGAIGVGPIYARQPRNDAP